MFVSEIYLIDLVNFLLNILLPHFFYLILLFYQMRTQTLTFFFLSESLAVEFFDFFVGLFFLVLNKLFKLLYFLFHFFDDLLLLFRFDHCVFLRFN